MMKKQDKYKNRQREIRGIFADIMRGDESREKTNIEDNNEEDNEEINPIEIPKELNYFDKTYENSEPVKPIEIQNPPPPIEKPKYANQYEEDLDNLAGLRIMPSRRNRIKSFI